VNSAVIGRVADKLQSPNLKYNVALIRRALWEEAGKLFPSNVDKVMKKELFRRACLASLVLDLHCDSGKCFQLFCVS
jgi:hypothetical protein